MAENRLAYRVGLVAQRLQRLRRRREISTSCLIVTGVALLLLITNSVAVSPVLPAGWILAGGALLMVLIWWRSRQKPVPTLRQAATLIEHRWPSLDSRLTTAIDQQPAEATGRFSYLQHEVISEALLHAHRHDWSDAIPPKSLARAWVVQVLCVVAAVCAFGVAAWTAHRQSLAARLLSTRAASDPAEGITVSVEPGDAHVERGTSLLVIARFDGQVPGEVTLSTTDTAGTSRSIPLSRSLNDPLFGGRIPSVDSDLSYRVHFEGAVSDSYQVKVFDFPRLERADAKIQSPDYTGLEDRMIADVRRVSLIEGSRLTLACSFNKPVQEAVLRPVDGSEPVLHLTAGTDERVGSVTFVPRRKQTFHLTLIDADGRSNKEPPEFVIDVVPNRPANLSVVFPARDARVSPLEEVSLEARADDDFGLREYGVIFQLPDRDEQALKLGDAHQGTSEITLAHQLSMEQIVAQPNDLVAYYFYADDIGPDGGLRRTFSDMYFAEVRHFDEEFRKSEAQQSAEGQMPAGAPSDQLLQVQRDIVNAIWNLIRRDDEGSSSGFAADVRSVAESQQQAQQMGHMLQSEQKDPLALQHLKQALEHMSVAQAELTDAADSSSASPLADARHAAYSAYQSLMKLNLREHLVQRSQSSAGGQSGRDSSTLSQQLQQLELDNSRNRYETERQDQPMTDREQVQVFNRLRELARRQSGLNERIQELEAALRRANAPEERNEIERQLKRLQEEQQQLLRDLDELNERMNNEQNRSRMADARQQVQDVRDHLLESSESLKEGMTSDALAAGTRAERGLNQMQDELRQQTAGQFDEALRRLRRAARELAERQQSLAEDLRETTGGRKSQPPSLKDEEPRTHPLEATLAEQQARTNELIEDLKEVIEAAEQSEPLLSKTLYEAVRDTRSDRPAESLEMAGQFLQHGLQQEAARAEAQARAGIEKLQEAIEKAANSVLGNEIESLRRAEQEIDELARAIESELAAADQESSDSSPASTSSSTTASDSDPQNTGESTSGVDPEAASRSSAERPANDEGGALSQFLQSENATEQGGAASGPGGGVRPLTGGDFMEWSDRMRDVEEMVDNPVLRTRVGQIRDRARQQRIDMKARHSPAPDWEIVRTEIYGPMVELRSLLAEEIARRTSDDPSVPLDRDPVPGRYEELVERYYERLGSGR